MSATQKMQTHRNEIHKRYKNCLKKSEGHNKYENLPG